MYKTSSIPRPSIIYPNRDYGSENMPSGMASGLYFIKPFRPIFTKKTKKMSRLHFKNFSTFQENLHFVLDICDESGLYILDELDADQVPT
jgi:hypothetical protein